MASSALRGFLVLARKTSWQRPLQTSGKTILDYPLPIGKIPERQQSTFPKLTPQQVNRILRAFEASEHVAVAGSVKSFDTNQLPSNNPIEDRRLEARCLLTTGMLFAVFDGHAGSACAEVVCQRLFQYVAAALLPYELLKEFAASMKDSNSQSQQNLLEMYNNEVIFSDELKQLHQQSFKKYVDMLVQSRQQEKEFQMEESLVNAFVTLDNHLSEEAQQTKNTIVHMDTVVTAATGSVACVVHVDGPHLHVAQAGDCQAVVGTLDETNIWVPRVLTNCHNSDNSDEVFRIISDHPKSESENVIINNRLLGQLAPLRAFGDFRFKWTMDMMKEIFFPVLGTFHLPPNYVTPPYLTATPEVSYFRLSPRDRFVVIGSDGLWDMLSPEKVVKLVGEYMFGKQTLDPVVMPKEDISLNEIVTVLNARKEGRNLKPRDRNAATHLIRNALGGTDYGVEHSVLSQMLSAPEDVVRLIRDDITINVVFFNDEYLRHCPA